MLQIWLGWPGDLVGSGIMYYWIFSGVGHLVWLCIWLGWFHLELWLG